MNDLKIGDLCKAGDEIVLLLRHSYCKNCITGEKWFIEDWVAFSSKSDKIVFPITDWLKKISNE